MSKYKSPLRLVEEDEDGSGSAGGVPGTRGAGVPGGDGEGVMRTWLNKWGLFLAGMLTGMVAALPFGLVINNILVTNAKVPAAVCMDTSVVIGPNEAGVTCRHRDHTMSTGRVSTNGHVHVSCTCPWHAPSIPDPWADQRPVPEVEEP